MVDLIKSLRSAVVYRLDSKDRTLAKRVKGYSLALPEIDEQEARKNAGALVARLLAGYPLAVVLESLKDSVCVVKSICTQTHNGFRTPREPEKVLPSQRDRIKKGVLRTADDPPQGGNANEVAMIDVSDYQPPRMPSKT